QLRQMLEIVKLRLAKRGVDLACLEVKEPQTTLSAAHQEVVLRHGIDQETGRKIMRLIKDSKLKVQASLQGEKVRVSGKQRDELQAAVELGAAARRQARPPAAVRQFPRLKCRATSAALRSVRHVAHEEIRDPEEQCELPHDRPVHVPHAAGHRGVKFALAQLPLDLATQLRDL